MTDSTGKGCEPEARKKSGFHSSETITQRNGFLPLLDVTSRQCQKKPVSTNESVGSPAASAVTENTINLCTGGHAKGCTFLSLLPDNGAVYQNQVVPNHGPNAVSLSPGSQSAGARDTERPSHEHIARVDAQKDHVRPIRSKPVRRYEWPLIINGVYQGEGPLPSCRIEDDDLPAEPQPYAWPLIILHEARSVEDCDQQSSSHGKEADEGIAEKEKQG